jgi:glutamate synthase (NADPH/NADH) small chain
MEQQELRDLEYHCIQECAPWCTAQCPVHVDVKAMASAIRSGDFDGAAAVLQQRVPFPGIISLVCDHPCQNVCRRTALDTTVSIRALERAALNHSSSKRITFRSLPGTGKKTAVVGAGLSGLTVALELTRKGHKTTLFEASFSLGGSVWDHPKNTLPRKVIQEDFTIVRESPIAIRLGQVLGRDFTLSDLEEDYDAIYLGVGAGFAASEDLEMDEAGLVKADPVTFQTSRPGVFAGGSLRSETGPRSPIRSISDGRRAAISIDRYLQKVSLTASREYEGAYDTRLFTSIVGKESCPPVPVQDPVGGLTTEGAVQEASRCLQCECMECVKVCEYLATYKGYPKKYIRQIYNNLSIVAGHRQGNLMINSCSLCGLCKEVCPEDLHMGLVCKSARQTMVRQNKMPPSAHEFALRDMEFSTGDHFTLARHEPDMDSSSFLFFPGCQLSASSPENVKKTYAYLRQRLKGGVGLMLSCCGAPADWSGRADLFADTSAAFDREWQRLGSPTLITACSTCTGVFSERLPTGKVVSLWEVIDELGLPQIPQRSPVRVLVVHDPCTARHHARAQDSVRNILHELGYETSEIPLSRDMTECCGFGGLMCFADRDLAERVVQRRIDATPEKMLAYCAMCRDRFASQGKPTVHLLDLIFKGDNQEPEWNKGPDYSQRRENRARLKRSLLSELWNEVVGVAQENYRDITLHISDQVRELMEKRMILVEDVQQVVQWAEKTGRKLVHRQTGNLLAHYRPATVTYWVEYSPAEDGYTIHNAYCHRMHIEEDVKH